MVRSKGKLVAVMGLALMAAVCYADRRSYVWTYEYLTMPQGESEIEYYLTHKIADFHRHKDKNSWEHSAEYEYGLTDHWDVAIYQTWRHTNTKTEDSFDYMGSKFRMRYRVAEKNELPADLLVYGEYILPDASNEPERFEGKLIAAKDLGRWNLAYNQIYDRELTNGDAFEHKYACGVSYEFSPRFKLAFESIGSYTEEKFYVGPTISLASEKFWVNVGALRGLNDRSDDLQFRMILGIPF